LRTEEFDYFLPDDRIARHPTVERDGARMLVVRRDGLHDDWVRNWAHEVPEGALVVLNDTRVRRARLLGHRRGSGGRVEFLLLERRIGSVVGASVECWAALARPLRSLRKGSWVDAEGLTILIGDRIEDGRVEVELHAEAFDTVEQCVEHCGHIPIPPYLGREDEPDDAIRYQTVFAERQGSVAAPTAGLHLTKDALEVLAARGVAVGQVTLHVGIGTFRPVSVDDLNEHPMHSEQFEVSAGLAEKIADTRRRNGRVIAVGTTVVRALESAKDPERPGYVIAQSACTRLLIQPGYRFGVVDGLLTNFHQPRSTLLSLVAAGIGLSQMKKAYEVAVARGYRFLSYGDAMWIPELIQ
jgi:S-adenosylmethionine:tRNA ribosyltransferase-isomerase